jgi:transcriptional regulator GlxA family with amidase domain
MLPLSQLIKELLFYLLLHPQTSNAKSLVSIMTETLTENLVSYGTHMGLSTEHLSGKIRDTRIRKVVSLMQDHIGDKISIDEIAKQSGLSSRNLNRLMLQEIGLTPKQFLITARIEYAQKLLLKPGASVTDVALSVGYNSLSQFITVFRSQTGQLPSEVARIGRKPKL